jgi:hypothetical protein
MFDFSIFQTNAKLAQDAATQVFLATSEYTKSVAETTSKYTNNVQEQVATAFKPAFETANKFFKKA